MRNIIIAFALCVAIASAQTAQTYQLVWQDEFDGTSLDLSKWQYEVNCDGGGNSELQCYTNSPSNVAVRNGTLVITAQQQNLNGKQFTSGRINTARSAAWKYGRIDFSAKTPNGLYMWPALWMMPRDSVYGWWAASGEIDIMENRGTTNQQESTLHYGGSWPNNVYQGSGAQRMSFDMTADFHLYSAIWTPTSIQFLVDNNVYHTQTLQRNFWSGSGNNPYTANGQPFDQYFYIIINLALGGGFFGGEANSLTPAIAQQWKTNALVVDYVRVYQLKDSVVAPVTPVAAPLPTPVATTAAASTPSSTACSAMYASLTCRTTSGDATKVDATGVTNSRNWLCGAYPQLCTAINNGGTYSGCNAVEQLSYAMNLYYTQFSAQGADCNFGGIGQLATPVAAPKTSTQAVATTAAPSTSSCSAMWDTLSCRTASQDASKVDANSVASSRNWLCNAYPQYCTAIASGGSYAGCNAVEQLSYAMSQYYNTFGAAQGATACSFGGIGNVIVASATPKTSSSTAFTPVATAAAAAQPCARAGYCASNMCACNGACYNTDSYCCINNNLVQKAFC